MQTVAQTPSVVQFETALVAAAGRAHAKFTTASTRIDKALELVEADAVTDMTRLRPHWYTVRSQTDRSVWYNVVSNGATVCDCPDYTHHGRDNPEYGCKHCYAVLLVRAARRDMKRTVIHPLRHAYHMESGEEGHARELGDGRVAFYPGGRQHSFLCMQDELCLGPRL